MSDESPARAPGVVYTFYSYKGGVGRSMALANVGTLLALAGKSVLLIDWDLEAPGLETYFRAAADLVGDPAAIPGVVDLLEAHVDGKPLMWTDCLIRAEFLQVSLDIISSGRRSPDYRSRVQKLDWDSMYREHQIGNFVNQLREEWRFVYDFVLIDSRTGFTDIGDICTVLLPDAIVLMFVSSYQNVEGIKAAMTRAVAARKKLPVNRNKLHGIPLPGRDEAYNEYKQAQEWKEIYAKELGYLYQEWLPKEVTPADALNKLFIPYVTNWSFGERIPVLESRRETQNPTSIGAAYQRLANLLASELDWYSLESKASVEDLQAAQIELQRERAKALGLEERSKLELEEERAKTARLETQRKRMGSVTALSLILALLVVLVVWFRPNRVAVSPNPVDWPEHAASTVDLSTDLDEGRRLLEAGRLDGALKIFQALETTRRAQLAKPDDSKQSDAEKQGVLTDYDLANSYAGDALLAAGRSTEALMAYARSLEARKSLVAMDPASPESQRQLAIRHGDIGRARSVQGKVMAALESYLEGKAILDKLGASPENVRMRAISDGQIGAILEVQGKLDEAMRAYQSARENLSPLTESDPLDPAVRRSLAVTDFQIGSILRAEGNLNEAMKSFKAFRETAALTQQTEDRVVRRDLAVGNAMVAETLRDQGNLPEAARIFRTANEITNELAAKYPAETLYRRDQATRAVAQGALLQDQGRYRDALIAFRTSEAIMRKLTALDSASADWQNRLAMALSRVGDVSTLLGQFVEGERALKEAQAIMEGVVARDDSNLDALSTLSFQHKRLGSLYLAQKRGGNAIDALGKAEDMAIKLARAAPSSAYWRRHFMEITRLRSEALLLAKDVGRAQLALELAQRVRSKAQVTRGSEVYWEPETARLEVQAGNVLVAMGDAPAARKAFVRAEQTLARVTALDPTNVTWRKDLAKVRERIGSLGTTVD